LWDFGINVLAEKRKVIVTVGKSETFWIRRNNISELHGVRCSVEGLLVFDITQEGQLIFPDVSGKCASFFFIYIKKS